VEVVGCECGDFGYCVFCCEVYVAFGVFDDVFGIYWLVVYVSIDFSVVCMMVLFCLFLVFEVFMLFVCVLLMVIGRLLICGVYFPLVVVEIVLVNVIRFLVFLFLVVFGCL